MAWIESHESLPGHPKTKRMCRLLKIPLVLAVGHLHFLWWWAMNHAQDGDLERYTATDIADACGWEGDEHEFFNALVSSGFIDESDTGYCIHDWYSYAGKLIEIRKKDADRKKKSREKKVESDGSPVDVQRTSGGHPEESNGRRSESTRDLDLNLITTTTTTEGEPETVTDAHQRVFGTLSMNGLMQGYVMLLKSKGFTDRFIVELMLETGESATKPSLRLMQTIGERWARDKIYTRVEAKARKTQSAQPVALPMKPKRIIEEPVYEPKVVI